jgi:trans-aconitate 2-methyltransferase
MTWDPNKYLQFGDERTRPAVDLAARIAIENPRTVIDLGCGPGNSTQVLRQRWQVAAGVAGGGIRIYGLDNSPEMIGAARAAFPQQEWVLGRIEDWSASEPHDVVFSNAALQWAKDHVVLTRRLFGQVAPGGALAFQIPSGEFSPVRSFIHEIARDPAWAPRMVHALNALTMEAPHVYYDALAASARSVDIWETEYHHVIESPPAIVEWMSSTGLRPFLNALNSADEKQRFLAILTQRVADAYTTRADGRVLFPFKRTFVIAYA